MIRQRGRGIVADPKLHCQNTNVLKWGEIGSGFCREERQMPEVESMVTDEASQIVKRKESVFRVATCKCLLTTYKRLI